MRSMLFNLGKYVLFGGMYGALSGLLFSEFSPIGLLIGFKVGCVVGAIVAPICVALLRRKPASTVDPILIWSAVPLSTLSLFHPLGAVVTVLAFLALVVILAVKVADEGADGTADTACRSCGYSLYLNETGRCPECGTKVGGPVDHDQSNA